MDEGETRNLSILLIIFVSVNLYQFLVVEYVPSHVFFFSLVPLIPLFYWVKTREAEGKDETVRGKIFKWKVMSIPFFFLLVMIPRVTFIYLYNYPFEKISLTYLVVLAIYLFKLGNLGEYGFTLRRAHRNLLMGLILFTLTYLTLGLCLPGIFLIGEESRGKVMVVFTKQFLKLRSYISLDGLCQIAFLLLGVSLSEESFFRGYVITNLEKTGFSVSLILSSILFGLFHVSWHLFPLNLYFMALHVFFATLFGLVVGSLFMNTGSLLGPILVHTAWNMLPNILGYLYLVKEAELLIIWLSDTGGLFLIIAISFILAEKLGVKRR